MISSDLGMVIVLIAFLVFALILVALVWREEGLVAKFCDTLVEIVDRVFGKRR